MECLTGVGSSATTEAGKYLLPKIKKHICYMFKYDENLKSLEVAAEELDAKRTDAIRFAEETRMKQQVISNVAALWKSKADELHEKARKEISETKISCLLHPWSRYSTSKHAWELVQEINEEVQIAPDFGIAFDAPAPKLGHKFNHKGYTDFVSRLTVLNGILEALTDEDVNMCSICGMGGVGKTTLAKKLILSVEADRLFDKVVMVTVSQNPNFEKIQNEIIELLGVTITQSTMPKRARKLNEWLTDNRTLLILDDVWWQLSDEDFEDIGIPLACKGCKIVVTSRNEDECKNMGSQRIFLINVLDDVEAWDLFRQNAGGTCVEDLNLQEIARNITAECDGLPIAIVTVAKALEGKPKAIWNDSLLQLQKSNLVGISPRMEKVYSRIRLSYDLLNDCEAQSCFRLCCLFPEDHNIPIESLVFYGKGLQFFANVESMSATRDRVESIIHRLKKSFLLLDGDEDGTIKMHDILRDFAMSISSKDDHPYVVGCEKVMEKWPESSPYEKCSAISFVCEKINKHPVDLSCPKLELLHLVYIDNLHQVELPIGFFEGMKELKVLVLKSLPLLQSLATATKLRTLVIETSFRVNMGHPDETPKIGDLLGQGALKNLEILVFRTYRLCCDFPKEIGLLSNLRCLRFSEVRFEYMPPGVLSKLVKLEELELSPKFTSWGCKEGNGGERVNASLDEIESLLLTALEINVGKKGSILSKKLVNSPTRFHVCMGSYMDLFSLDYETNAVLEVHDVDASDVRLSWISCLLSKCESLGLMGVRNLNNIMCLQQSDTNKDYWFPQLKDIYIYRCSEMEYLVDSTVVAQRIPSTFFSQLNRLKLCYMDSMKEICNLSKIIEPIMCFSNLSSMYISLCPKLEHLFPLSVATQLRQLQSIFIMDCAEMEAVFYQINTEENIAKVDEIEVDHFIIFPRLKALQLQRMDKLRILYDGNHAIKLPKLQKLTITRQCDKMEGLSYGSIDAPRLYQIMINDIDYPVVGEDLNAIVKKMAAGNQK